MARSVDLFERIARVAYAFTDREAESDSSLHPFDRRNIHPKLPAKVRKLFDDGHYAEATFAAFKFVDKEVQRLSMLAKTGEGLMMQAFNEAAPILKLTPLSNPSEVDEQRGYKFIFSGGAVAIRNPRAHEDALDDIDKCLDHLSFASLLIRRLEEAGLI